MFRAEITEPNFVRIGLAMAMAALTMGALPTAEAHDTEPQRIIVPDAERYKGGPAPWTSLDAVDGPSRFHFAIVADRTGGHRLGIFEKSSDVLNLLQPAFTVSVGDFIEGYTTDRAELSRQWKGVQSVVDEYDAPFFFTPGNHDLSNDTQLEEWRRRFGADYYHFIYKNTLFLVLNSEIFPEVAGSIGALLGSPSEPAAQFQKQMSYVENVLEKNPDVRWTFVLLHQPVWTFSRYLEAAPGWERLEALLGNRPHTLFAGHTHVYEHALDAEHKHDRITLATTGGESRMRGVAYGEFDHVAWVTMTEKGPVIANVLLDGVLPKSIPVAQNLATAHKLIGAVRAEPLVVESERFTAGEQVIRLSNPTETKIAVNGVFRASANLTAEPAGYEAILDPGEERVVPVKLRAAKPTAVESVAAIDGRWEISRLDDDDETFRVESVTALLPERVYGITAQDRPIKVDGRLSDWGGAGALRFQGASEITGRQHYFGADDLSFTFDTRIHKDHLYIAVDVSDDVLALDSAEGPTNRDFVQIHLDLRDAAEMTRNLPFFQEMLRLGAERQFLKNFLFLTIDPRKGDRLDLEEELLNRLWLAHWPGVQAKADVRENGYSVEIAIPWKDKRLGGKDASAPSEIRFNVMVNDMDGGAQRSEHYWRTSRFHEFSHPRAGVMKVMHGGAGNRPE